MRDIRIDCGAGTVALPGFIGVDRFALPGVDVVLDLNGPLPLRSDSADLVFACHSLEHVRDLMATLREIYRICRDGAQVCIIAPYGMTSLNLANPYHLQFFNEHTPRFWTSSPFSLIDRNEYADGADGMPWGLSRSDHSDPGFEFQCTRMELFYFPAYRSLPRAEQRAARERYLNVCEEIMYHLVVTKRPVNLEALQAIARSVTCYEPPSITARREREGGSSL